MNRISTQCSKPYKKAIVGNVGLFLFVSLFFISPRFYAQSTGCPQVSVSPDVSICTGCTQLTATVQGTVETTSYTVSSIPYNPYSYTVGTVVTAGVDDVWSPVINLPFCFQFYGNTYNQFVIGSNAVISFDVANANGYNTWPINAPMPGNAASDMHTCIMAPWHDIDPSVGSSPTPTITWSIQGTAPCRALVVSWANVPMFSCNAMIATSQAVLYETTNIIDIFIQNKPLCSTWNSGAAIEGIQDPTGTLATISTGRNYPTQWTASNDGQRFTPSGNPQYTLTWYDGNNTAVGTTPTINVCPTTTTTYTAKVVNTTCNGPITVSAPVTVTVTGPPCSGVTCNFTASGDTVCVGSTVHLTADTVTNATYMWIGPNGFTSTARNPVITNADSTRTGWYYVRDSIPFCSSIDSVHVLINTGPTVNAGLDQSICGDTAQLTGVIGGGGIHPTWSGGTGTYSPNDTALNCSYIPSASEINAGHATLTLTANASGSGCAPATDQVTISISQNPTVSAGPNQHVCIGQTFNLLGLISGTTSAAWSGGSGTFSPNNTTLNAVYTPSAAEYTSADSIVLTLTTATSGSCPIVSDSVTLSFDLTPVVNFSADSLSGCKPHCVLFSDSTTVGGNSTITSWTWDFGDGGVVVGSQNTEHCYNTPGVYNVKLKTVTNNGCSADSTKTNYIQVFNNPIAEFEVNPTSATILDPSITMNNLSSQDVVLWNWNFGDSTSLVSTTQSPTHVYPDDTATSYIVTLIVQNNGGCADTVKHTVVIGPGHTLYLPNAFTPNHDGNNDLFGASGTGIKKYEMRIFDRWGNMVFFGKSIDDHWDGKVLGKGSDNTLLIQDVYVWKVSLTDVFNKTHTYYGTVTLVK